MTIRLFRGLLLLFASVLAGTALSQVPYVYLNHIALTLDSATYADIRRSSFVRDALAGTRSDTVTTEDGTWTGTVLAGENNSIRLSAAGAGSELVLRCEQNGCSAGIAQILNTMSAESLRTELRHPTGTRRPGPAYRKTWSGETRSGTFSTWFYEPVPDAATPDRALGRRAMNARWYRPQRLMKDVVEVTVALESAAIRKLTQRLSAFRFGAMFTGSTTVLGGPDVRLRLVPEAGGGRVTRIVFGLNRAKKGEKEYRFGPRSVLKFDNAAKTATWTF
jgi:hypothetical protein